MRGVAAGNVREVFFQLAFAGYVGAFFNLNPFLDRDGYQILCEWLREPRAQAARAPATAGAAVGHGTAEESSRCSLATRSPVWSGRRSGAGFVAVLSLRYYSVLVKVAPKGVVVGGFIVFFVVLLLPIPLALGAPLVQPRSLRQPRGEPCRQVKTESELAGAVD